MITKLLFTALVIVIVGALFHKQQHARNNTGRPARSTGQHEVERGSLAPKTLAYGLVGLLILASSVIYFFSWRTDNELITLRVINAQGEATQYQTRRADLKKREFLTLDSKRVRLADSDRLEILETP